MILQRREGGTRYPQTRKRHSANGGGGTRVPLYERTPTLINQSLRLGYCILFLESPWPLVHHVFTPIERRVVKCHGYDGYIRVKILAGWGKSLGEHPILQNQAFLGNICTQYNRFMGIK